MCVCVCVCRVYVCVRVCGVSVVRVLNVRCTLMAEIGIFCKIDLVVVDCFCIAFWWQGDSV